MHKMYTEHLNYLSYCQITFNVIVIYKKSKSFIKVSQQVSSIN